MGKNCGYSSSEGLFAVDSLIEDIVKSYTVSAFNIQGKFSCDVLSRITLPYTSECVSRALLPNGSADLCIVEKQSDTDNMKVIVPQEKTSVIN
ncbi:hypothetical protein RIR_jg40917.t1 [Rhizophagus irregularis DAOM 181602=DAOM 197198]|nr:hypothetical protein RIR_jg40917.t1 [Rhizophagus irregularis DAOM 181602=DAOM 197198]